MQIKPPKAKLMLDDLKNVVLSAGGKIDNRVKVKSIVIRPAKRKAMIQSLSTSTSTSKLSVALCARLLATFF